MRLGNKRRRDYTEPLEAALAKDFPRMRQEPTQRDKVRQNANSTKIRKHLRVAEIGEKCEYRKFARFFVGKAVELVELHDSGKDSGWYKFVFDDDREALNKAAGWSAKQKYLLTRPKFK